MTTRRQFLTHATLPVAAAVAFTAPAALVRAEANPDAELIDLFRAWVVNRSRYDTSEDISDEEGEAINEEGARLSRAMAAIPARTLTGLACKAHLKLHWDLGSAFGAPAALVEEPELSEHDYVDDALTYSLRADAMHLLAAYLPPLNAGLAAA